MVLWALLCIRKPSGNNFNIAKLFKISISIFNDFGKHFLHVSYYERRLKKKKAQRSALKNIIDEVVTITTTLSNITEISE